MKGGSPAYNFHSNSGMLNQLSGGNNMLSPMESLNTNSYSHIYSTSGGGRKKRSRRKKRCCSKKCCSNKKKCSSKKKSCSKRKCCSKKRKCCSKSI